MEELLNKLIKKWWKPFGDYDIAEFNQIANTFVAINYESKVIGQPKLRQIVSKESWLWQFVCENKLVKVKDKKIRYRYEDIERTQNYFSWYWYEYRIIESALCNEEDLEKFLLDNIKVKW